MDASVALMNQYTMIASQFPLPPIPTPATSADTSAATTVETNTTEETVANPSDNADETKATATASPTDALNSVAGPSTSKAAIERAETDSTVTIEDIGRNDPSEPDGAVSEVRRRRLQRFETKGVDS